MQTIMTSVSTVIFNMFIFLSVYVQVFFLITFFENRKKIVTRTGKIKLATYPSVTVIVPCWNEELTIKGTVDSLLELNYPQDKLKILLVDDGSTDNTLDVIRSFEKYENVKIFHKENGGKHTALNFGIKRTDTDFLGCLDADSMADKEALVRIMSYFEKSPTTMAVSPSVVTNKPKSILQSAQKVEYDMSVYVKKMLGLIGGIHVTPGPLTIFRMKVFDDLGPYRHAHNTEDMEIAYRMQKNHYSIDQCNDAYVYTNTPNTVKKLHKQRLRWLYGFINNTIDYKDVLFKKKYGNFSFFTLPAGILSVVAASYLIGRFFYKIGDIIYLKIVEYETVGFHISRELPTIDPFFLSTQSTFLFIIILLYILVITSIVLGRKMSEEKSGFSFDMVYFFIIYGIIAPFWLINAVYSTVLSKKPTWR